MTDAQRPAQSGVSPAAPAGGTAGRIDSMMEEASVALVKRKYFAVESLCTDALRMALAADDYARAARICMPLLEARRLKRQLAIDARRIEIVSEPVTEGVTLHPGCYIVCPPRVGAEARAIRQFADAAEVPIIVIAREPVTRAGLCPVVAVGPVTVRAFIHEPPAAAQRPSSKPRKGAKPSPDASAPAPAAPASVFGAWAPPPLDWVLAACEALGDAAIAQASSPVAADRAAELFARLQSCPDHEKLHQRLMEACELAAREPRKRKPVPQPPDDDEFGEGGLSSEE